MAAVIVISNSVRDWWEALNRTSWRQFHLKALKISFVGRISLESNRPWLGPKRTISLCLNRKRLKVIFVTRTTDKWRVGLTPIILPSYLLTIQQSHVIHDVWVSVSRLVGWLPFERNARSWVDRRGRLMQLWMIQLWIEGDSFVGMALVVLLVGCASWKGNLF